MSYYLQLALALFGYMNVWFLISVLLRRNDVADIAWGLGFVFLTGTAFVNQANPTLPSIVATLLVAIWGSRLAWHIFLRNKNKKEDYRYAAWRQAWGNWFYIRSYLQVFLLQGVLLYCIALPVLVVTRAQTTGFTGLSFLGVLIWGLGFFFETVGDWQLAAFTKDPDNKGKLMTTGLWSYTRHPNYFGEVTQWWGLWMMALPYPGGWLSIVGPATITFLILKVSGLPMLEQKMAEKPGFEEYARRVSVFLPLPPKKE